MKHTAYIGRRSLFNRKQVDFFYPYQSIPFKGNAFLPGVAVVPLKQYAGIPARPVLRPGTFVREGQVIAVSEGRRSAVIHSSVPGVLRGYKTMPLMDGTSETAAVIQLSGAFDISGKRRNSFAWEGASPGMLLRLVEDFGLLRTFNKALPLAFLLQSFIAEFASKAPPEAPEGITGRGILAVRMCDIDPSCSADDFLVKNKFDDVVTGCAILAKILGVRKVCFLHGAETTVFQTDVSGCFHHAPVEIKQSVIQVYPCGNGFMCAEEATRLFAGSRNEDVFCVDPWTACSVCGSICFHKPTLQRPVLIAGSAIGKQCILNVRVGTRIGDIIEECGGFKFSPAKIIANGLLAGNAVYDLDTPVDQGTRSLHFLGKSECPRQSVHHCIHCGRCLRICPHKLDPIRIACNVRKNPGKTIPEASKCVLCGVCAAVCPSRIPLHHIINSAKKEFEGGLFH